MLIKYHPHIDNKFGIGMLILMLEKIFSSKSWITKFTRTGDPMGIPKICLKNLLSNLKYIELIIKEIAIKKFFFWIFWSFVIKRRLLLNTKNFYPFRLKSMTCVLRIKKLLFNNEHIDITNRHVRQYTQTNRCWS